MIIADEYEEKRDSAERDSGSFLRYGHSTTSVLSDSILLLILSYLSPLCRVFIYLKQTMFLGYIVLQLFCTYSLCYT